MIIDQFPAGTRSRKSHGGRNHFLRKVKKADCVAASAPGDAPPEATSYMTTLACLRNVLSILDTWVSTPAMEGRKRTTRCCVGASGILRVRNTLLPLVALPFKALPVRADLVGIRRRLKNCSWHLFRTRSRCRPRHCEKPTKPECKAPSPLDSINRQLDVRGQARESELASRDSGWRQLCQASTTLKEKRILLIEKDGQASYRQQESTQWTLTCAQDTSGSECQMASGCPGGTSQMPSSSGRQMSSRQGEQNKEEKESASLPQHRPGDHGSRLSARSCDKKDFLRGAKRSNQKKHVAHTQTVALGLTWCDQRSCRWTKSIWHQANLVVLDKMVPAARSSMSVLAKSMFNCFVWRGSAASRVALPSNGSMLAWKLKCTQWPLKRLLELVHVLFCLPFFVLC